MSGVPGGPYPDELFRSTLLEERLPAQNLLRKCSIHEDGPGQLSALVKSGRQAVKAKYFCAYMYDHILEDLKALPAA